MKKDELQEKVREVENLIKGIETESVFRPAIFQVVLSNLILRDDTIKSTHEDQSGIGENIEDGQDTANISRLVTETDMEEEQLRDIFDFAVEGPRLIASGSLGDSVAERQQVVAILHLTTLYYCYGRDRETADILRESCEDLGIVDKSNNFSRNLSFISEFIRSIGKRNSVKKLYKITIAGRREGVNYIKRLAGVENE